VDRLLLLLGIAAVAGMAAALLQRRTDRRPVRTGWTVPDQVRRGDFARPGTPWLVAVFTSSTCEACDGVLSRARPLESSEVAVVEVEANADREVHDRYGIDAVPLVLVVDDEGAVRHHHLGPVTSTHLWASLAEVRQPGSVPDGCSAS
tara:strand:- start:6104 stop:6547 length:444 start_codon:yes stop_codon:yes gene_type:complete